MFIADRSPFSAVFYAANKTGSLLEPVIRAHMKEVREAAGIEVYTVYLEVERELLWSRIQQRLKREPGRVKYNEDKREWMEATLNFYDNFKWDLVRVLRPCVHGGEAGGLPHGGRAHGACCC